MTLPLLIALSLSTAVPAASSAFVEPGVHVSTSGVAQKVSLLGGMSLDATYMPSQSPPLRLTDDLRFGLAGTPGPLDMGGALHRGGGAEPILALLLGLIVGFGTGHLVAHDRNGFVLFLVIDIVIIALSSVLNFAVLQGGLFYGIGGLALLISHIIQGLDAYGEAGGERIIEVTRERAVRLASVGSGGSDAPVITTRGFSFNF